MNLITEDTLEQQAKERFHEIGCSFSLESVISFNRLSLGQKISIDKEN